MNQIRIEKNKKGIFNIYIKKNFFGIPYWSSLDFVSAGMDATYIAFPLEFTSISEVEYYLVKNNLN